jgi:hypothetical protein
MSALFHRIKKNPLKMAALFLTGPVIYGLFFVFLLADICATFYQLTCFPVYGIPRVKRRDHIVMDRGKLQYLNTFDKINCIYCEYANGVIAYAGEIIARTEWFWCPIKHGKEIVQPHDHYGEFLEYGDGQNYRGKLKEIRKKCRACETGCATKQA